MSTKWIKLNSVRVCSKHITFLNNLAHERYMKKLDPKPSLAAAIRQVIDEAMANEPKSGVQG